MKTHFQYGAKVYIISKSTGRSMQEVVNRLKRSERLNLVKIRTDLGIFEDAIPAFFTRYHNYGQSESYGKPGHFCFEREVFTLNYEQGISGGDFYLREDFFLESEVVLGHMHLPEDLFEI